MDYGAIKFPQVRWREGYDIAEVDAFVIDVERELAGPLPNNALAERIRSSRFTPRRIARAYDMQAVDEYLDRKFDQSTARSR